MAEVVKRVFPSKAQRYIINYSNFIQKIKKAKPRQYGHFKEGLTNRKRLVGL